MTTQRLCKACGSSINPAWTNGLVEAWTLHDGTLIIRTRINRPMDGFDHYFTISTLAAVEEFDAAQMQEL